MSTVTAPLLQHDRDELDATVLRTAFGRFPTGVVGVAALDPTTGSPIGFAASSFVGVSLDPPIVAFCIQWTSGTWPVLEELPRIGISVLGESHDATAKALAAKGRDRFAGLTTRSSEQGAVFIDGAACWLETSVREVVAAGDHGIVLLDVHALTTPEDVEPLVFHGSAFRRLQTRA